MMKTCFLEAIFQINLRMKNLNSQKRKGQERFEFIFNRLFFQIETEEVERAKMLAASGFQISTSCVLNYHSNFSFVRDCL